MMDNKKAMELITGYFPAVPYANIRYAAAMGAYALEKQEKYRWHDLRKDPDDLPEPEVECEVVVERTYSNYRMNEHARMLELTDGIYWYAEHYGVVQHPKYKMGYGGDHTIEVIAWRKIEPFREVE